MQNGEVVQIGTGCPATNDGQHQAEDWCRQCGGVAGVKALQDEIEQLKRLLREVQDELYDIGSCERNHYPETCTCPDSKGRALARMIANALTKGEQTDG